MRSASSLKISSFRVGGRLGNEEPTLLQKTQECEERCRRFVKKTRRKPDLMIGVLGIIGVIERRGLIP